MAAETQESLFEIRIRVPREEIDLVCDFVIERICSGLVLEDEDGSENATVLFYAPPADVKGHVAAVRGYLTHLFGTGSDTDGLVTLMEIGNRSWEDEYRRSVRPVIVGRDVVIRPPWTDAPVETPYDIVIEPKMAFGTGTHETTRSCLKVIRESFQSGTRFLDLGCGSGILSILADKIGASYIKAIDYDLVAIDNCRENFTLNRVGAPHEIVFGSIEKCRGNQPYDFVIANIIKSTILDMLPRLVELTARPGMLVLSGLLEQDVNEIGAVLDKLNATDRSMLADNEWRTITVTLS